MQDILRTHPDSDFFQKETIKTAMLNCLFLFAKENGETSYRQGMHELLAVIMYLLHDEKIEEEKLKNSSLSGDSVACSVISARHFESDAFTLFRSLMKHANPWFEVVDTRTFSSASAPEGAFIADKKQAEEAAVAQSPIVTKCRKIQYLLLKKHDGPLHNYLKTLGIEPQLYALKWIRLLFGREFHIADVVTLWDAIFAWGQGLALVDMVSVVMLIYIREAILGKEYTDAMARLMKFPPVEDVSIFIESALRLMGNKDDSSVSLPVASKMDPLEKSKPLVFSGNRSSTSKSPTPAANAVSLETALNAANAAEKKLEDLRESNDILARRLAHVVSVLQIQMLSEEARVPDMDAVLVSIAELKQMKDILNGSLDPGDAHLLFGEKLNPRPQEVANEQEAPPVVMGEQDGLAAAAAPSTLEEEGNANKEPEEPKAAVVVAPVATKKDEPVMWGDDEEELGVKKTGSLSSSWLSGIWK